jgi:hypothetical protein
LGVPWVLFFQVGFSPFFFFFFLLYLYLDLANPTYMWMLSCHHVNNVEFFSWPAAISFRLMW